MIKNNMNENIKIIDKLGKCECRTIYLNTCTNSNRVLVTDGGNKITMLKDSLNQSLRYIKRLSEKYDTPLEVILIIDVYEDSVLKAIHDNDTFLFAFKHMKLTKKKFEKEPGKLIRLINVEETGYKVIQDNYKKQAYDFEDLIGGLRTCYKTTLYNIYEKEGRYGRFFIINTKKGD